MPTSITPATTTLNLIGNDEVVLTLSVGDTTTGGTVSFWFNDVFFGTAPVIDGIASASFQNMTPGQYTVRASYSGDAYYATSTISFNVKVQNLSWLPAVLELLE